MSTSSVEFFFFHTTAYCNCSYMLFVGVTGNKPVPSFRGSLLFSFWDCVCVSHWQKKSLSAFAGIWISVFVRYCLHDSVPTMQKVLTKLAVQLRAKLQLSWQRSGVVRCQNVGRHSKQCHLFKRQWFVLNKETFSSFLSSCLPYSSLWIQ